MQAPLSNTGAAHAVASPSQELGLPLDMIVVDFSTGHMGEYKFDEKYWPDVPGISRRAADSRNPV